MKTPLRSNPNPALRRALNAGLELVHSKFENMSRKERAEFAAKALYKFKK